MVFYLDGEPLLTDYTGPYEFVLPSAKWADGDYLLEVEDLTRYNDPITLQPFTTARASLWLTFANGNATAPTSTNVFSQRRAANLARVRRSPSSPPAMGHPASPQPMRSLTPSTRGHRTSSCTSATCTTTVE